MEFSSVTGACTAPNILHPIASRLLQSYPDVADILSQVGVLSLPGCIFGHLSDVKGFVVKGDCIVSIAPRTAADGSTSRNMVIYSPQPSLVFWTLIESLIS